MVGAIVRLSLLHASLYSLPERVWEERGNSGKTHVYRVIAALAEIVHKLSAFEKGKKGDAPPGEAFAG